MVKEVVDSGRNRIMNLLDVDNEESIDVVLSKEGKDRIHTVTKTYTITNPCGGKEKHTSRKMNNDETAFLGAVDEISYYARIGAFYDDEDTKELIRIWVEVDVEGGKNPPVSLGTIRTGEILNADDLSIGWREPKL